MDVAGFGEERQIDKDPSGRDAERGRAAGMVIRDAGVPVGRLHRSVDVPEQPVQMSAKTLRPLLDLPRSR
jgi:hypothetical protein